jgi:hypothetical protein
MFSRIDDSVVIVTDVSLRRGMLIISVADPGCYPGSRILIFIYPGSNFSNKKGEGKILLSYLICSHKFHKIENYVIFEQSQKKFEQID